MSIMMSSSPASCCNAKNWKITGYTQDLYLLAPLDTAMVVACWQGYRRASYGCGCDPFLGDPGFRGQARWRARAVGGTLVQRRGRGRLFRPVFRNLCGINHAYICRSLSKAVSEEEINVAWAGTSGRAVCRRVVGKRMCGIAFSLRPPTKPAPASPDRIAL